jgi:hypothetical protein
MELSQRAYARHRGVSETAVRKALKEGRITKNENGKIDPNLADKGWDANTDPAQIKEVAKSEDEVNSYSPAPLGPSYQQSRAIKEAYNAKLTRLQFEKESKKLISVDEVKISAFNAARMTRDRILNIPDRVIPLLVGKTDIHEMKETLKAELTKALEELSKS